MDKALEVSAQFYSFIADPNNLVILALVALGIMLKRMDFIRNDLIPLILLIVGVFFTVWLVKPVAVAMLRGVIYAAIAQQTYEVIVKYVITWIEKKFGINIQTSGTKEETK